MLENRDVRLPAGKSNDGGATHRARRRRRPTRPGHGQGHGQARPHAADPLLEVPQADAVRTRSLSALRIGVSRARGRNLTQIFEDLQRVREIDGPSRGQRKAPPRGKEVFVELYQCPACGRIVSEEATDCECGVRFGEPTTLTFACPECGSTMPSGSGGCPVCGVTFGPSGDLDVFVYSCPRCGSRVASDQARCSCGVWFAE